MKRVCNHSITPMLCFVDPFFICGIRTMASIPAFQAGDAGSTPVYHSKNEPIRKINSATRCLSPIRNPLSMPGAKGVRQNQRKGQRSKENAQLSGYLREQKFESKTGATSKMQSIHSDFRISSFSIMPAWPSGLWLRS